MNTRVMLAALGLCASLSPAPLQSADQEKPAYVQVRQTRLRAEPKYWSATLADMSYGNSLVSLGAAANDKSWARVRFNGVDGFVPLSSITQRKIILSAKQSTGSVGVDQGSIVMAGKGFNSQVENSFKTARGLDFAVVDEVERLGVESGEEATFIDEGRLAG